MVGLLMEVKVTTKRSDKAGKLRSYLRNPISADFLSRVKATLKDNIRDSTERPLAYHTYPSKHEGDLEASCFVELESPGVFIFGSTSAYANILEEGRGAQTARGKCFVFRGYYPNPMAIRAAMKRTPAWVEKLKKPMAEFAPKTKGFHEGERMYSKGKPYVLNKVTVTKVKGVRRAKEVPLTPREMTKQNLRFIENDLIGDIEEMKTNPTKKIDVMGRKKKITMKDFVKEKAERFHIPGAIPGEVPTKAEHLLTWGRVKKAAKYGIYTVFTKHTKAIPPYKVFTNTAKWAKEELIKEVKKGVRNVKYRRT
jgi:hypothetical protein